LILKSLISQINSWNDFKNLLSTKTELEKGKAFEELTKYFLKHNEKYENLKHVWLWDEIPPSVKTKCNLPKRDQGIDLFAETDEGTYWAIQCKYLQDEEQRLSHRAISTFISLSTGIAENIAHHLVCTTVDDFAKLYQGKKNITFVNSDEWRKLDKDFFNWLRAKLKGKEIERIPYKPKPHQTKALLEAKNYFIKEKNSRGKLVFPCGAGKSLTGYWITRELKSKSTIIAVPSLSLVKQTLEVYLRETVANKEKVSWLCVCSDEGIGKNDDVVIHTNEIGVPCVTDKTVIADWLKKNSKNKTIIFTTYQSGKTIAEACKVAKHSFELGIMDEAHKTVGDSEKLFSYLLSDKNIQIEKRIFMTATERRYAGSSDTVLSMDNVNVYGETFAQMSFKEAIDIGILSDYKIITLFISNEEVKKLIEQNAFVKPEGKEWDKETEARTLASLIALRKAMTEYPIHHAVTFHSSIKKAEAFDKSQSVFSSAYPKFANVESFHVSGAMNTAERGKRVDEFAQTKKGIITNAKCLTEGIDVPNIDCVLFADPRKSKVDIVQAVGRALRKKEGKKFGYVILPVFTESNNSDKIIESDEFKEILSTIRALAANDERIIEYFRDISKGKTKNKKDSIIHFDLDINIAEKINEKELIDTLELKIWGKLAKLSWMPFEEARDFIHTLKLKSQNEWRDYLKSGKKPSDIPSTPETTYRDEGWNGFGNWIGTNRIADQYKLYKNFKEANNYVKSLKLKSITEWKKYCKSGNKPHDIPANPYQTYKNNGWINYGGWLGTNNVANKNKVYLTFLEAKKYARSLNIKSFKDWANLFKSHNKPKDIPVAADRYYKNSGWKSWGDFLGNDNVWSYGENLIPFEDLKKFALKFEIKTSDEWRELSRTKKATLNLPASPQDLYKNDWNGWGDFLGTGRIADMYKEYLPFNEARKLARKLKLKSSSEWKKLHKTKNKPQTIPVNADRRYKNQGWKGWADFLGKE